MSAIIKHVAEATEKACTKCKVVKPLAEFHNDKYKRDGRTSSCAKCASLKSLEYKYASPENLRKAQERSRQWHIDNPEKSLESNRRTRRKHAAKQVARVKLNRAIRKGAIRRMPCEKCGRTEAQGHHEDYAKPLEVHWMCHWCHLKEHRSEIGKAALARGVG